MEDDDYLIYLINYIHRNPIHHGLTNFYSTWKYSSYIDILSNYPTMIKREYVISLFGSLSDFVSFHDENRSRSGIDDKYLIE